MTEAKPNAEKCTSCNAPLGKHCRSKHCPWETCVNPACKTTVNRQGNTVKLS